MHSNAHLVFHLFHGRTSPDERLEDWGSDGPGFLVRRVHVTYCCDIKLDFGDDMDGELLFVDGLVYYDGRFYGDWVVEPVSELIGDAWLVSRLTTFEARKAEVPELRRVPVMPTGITRRES